MNKSKSLNDYPEMLNVRMLAEILGVGYTKALNIVKYSTDLPYLKLGNTYRIHRKNLEKWLELDKKREYMFE